MDMEFLLAANTPPGKAEFPKSPGRRIIFAYRAEKPACGESMGYRIRDIVPDGPQGIPGHTLAKWSEMNHLN
jgi:hypothetical protein